MFPKGKKSIGIRFKEPVTVLQDDVISFRGVNIDSDCNYSLDGVYLRRASGEIVELEFYQEKDSKR